MGVWTPPVKDIEPQDVNITNLIIVGSDPQDISYTSSAIN